MNYDIIVIGAGVGGLTTSLMLSQAGKKVGIFEKHYIPGGYATNFIRKGKNGQIYKFDASLHALASLGKDGLCNSIFKDLGLLNKVDFLKDTHETLLTIGDKTYTFKLEFESFKKFLLDNFSQDSSAIKEIFNMIKKLFNAHHSHEAGRPTDLSDIIKDLQGITVEEFLKKYTDNKELIEVFGYLWVYLGLPPSELNAFFYFSAMGSYLLADTHYIKNGSGYMSKIMAEEIEKNGGKIHLISEIVNVQTENKKVVSVTTKNGDTFTANEFVFACDPNHLFTLIDSSDKEVDEYINNIKSFEKSMSITQLYIAIDCSTKEVGIDNSHIFVNKYDSSTLFNNIKNGNFNDLSICITSYDKMDPTLNEHGAFLNVATVDFASNWPERETKEYKVKKEEITKLLLNELCNMFPKIKEHIQVIELGTPRTMERYTNNTSGSIYGWAQNTKQGGFNRASFKTPFENAIVVGAWSFPGGGYTGAIYSGYLGSQRLLAKENTSTSSNTLMPIDSLMNGLIKKFNPENAEGINITYKFVFDEHDPIYLEVKNQTARLLPKSETPEKIDTTLTTTHEVWQKICFKELSGQDALMDGLITCEGNLKNFSCMPKIFDKQI